MTLQDWLKAGWLLEHKTSRQETADLFAMAARDHQSHHPSAHIRATPSTAYCFDRSMVGHIL
jgi:hypothetical protein